MAARSRSVRVERSRARSRRSASTRSQVIREVGRRLAAIPKIRSVAVAHSAVRAADGGTLRDHAERPGLLSRSTAQFAAQITTLPSSDDDFYFVGQWGLDAIDAPQAWATGQRGRRTSAWPCLTQE